MDEIDEITMGGSSYGGGGGAGGAGGAAAPLKNIASLDTRTIQKSLTTLRTQRLALKKGMNASPIDRQIASLESELVRRSREEREATQAAVRANVEAKAAARADKAAAIKAEMERVVDLLNHDDIYAIYQHIRQSGGAGSAFVKAEEVYANKIASAAARLLYLENTKEFANVYEKFVNLLTQKREGEALEEKEIRSVLKSSPRLFKVVQTYINSRYHAPLTVANETLDEMDALVAGMGGISMGDGVTGGAGGGGGGGGRGGYRKAHRKSHKSRKHRHHRKSRRHSRSTRRR